MINNFWHHGMSEESLQKMAEIILQWAAADNFLGVFPKLGL